MTDVSGNARPGTYTAAGNTYGAAGPCPRDGAGGLAFASYYSTALTAAQNPSHYVAGT